MINIVVDLMQKNIEKCLLENQRQFFSRRSEYSMLRNNNRDANAFLEFTGQKDTIRQFFQMLENKHATLFDDLVERLSGEASR